MFRFYLIAALASSAHASPFLFGTTETVTATTYTATTTSTFTSSPRCYTTSAGVLPCTRRKREALSISSTDEVIAPTNTMADVAHSDEVLAPTPEDREARQFGGIKYLTTVTQSQISIVTATEAALGIQTISIGTGCFPQLIFADIPECQANGK